MQELPDANAAETLGRLPGVSVLRSGGEGSKVVIRGLSPKYNKVMIEGVTLAAGDGDRSTNISMISPYSLDGIEVLKAATADQDADFIGGAVNFKLRTADSGWNFDFVAQGGYNNLKSTYNDYMLVGSVNNRFFEDKLGIYLQGNIEQRNRSSNELGASYELRNPQLDIDNTVYTEKLTITDAIRERSRYGATLVFDYRIPDGVINFKNFFSKSETSVDRYKETFGVNIGANSRIHEYIGSDEQYDLSTFTNILDYEQRFGSFKVDALLSYSSTRNNSTNLGFTAQQYNALSSDVLNDVVPPYELINYATINDSNTVLHYINDNDNETEESQFATELNLQYDFTLSNQINGNIKIGGKYRYKDRTYDQEVFSADFRLASTQDGKDAILRAFPWMQDTVPTGSYALPYTLFYNKNFDHKNFLEGEYSMGPVFDLELMHQVLDVLKNTEGLSYNNYSRMAFSSQKSDYAGNEYFYAGYVMAEINIGQYIKFIPGVRYEKNKTVYTGTRGDASLAFPQQNYVFHDTTLTRINEHFLPMIHLKYSPFEWFNARFAYTQTLSRPSYNQFMPRIDILETAVVWNNYLLEPEFAENFDLYLSFHENSLGLFTIGGFSKRIENMVFNLGKRVILDPSEYDLPDHVKNRNIFTTANNQYDATVWGIEVDWQTNFWYLPGVLKGIVLNINYTHIFSEAKYPRTVIEKELDMQTFQYTFTNVDTFYTDKLQNQPDDIFNVQLGYDYEGFSARLSMLYQSKIFKSPDYWPELSEYSDEYLRWDFSVKQVFPWYGIQIFCNVNNITGAKDRDLVQGAKWDSSIQHYGMTVDLGVRMKL